MEGRSWIDGKPTQINREVRIAYNPSNLSEEVGAIYYGEETHVYDAEEAAKDSFKTWSNLTGAERGNYLYKMAKVLEKHQKELATLASREMGKPITEMKGEVQRAIHLLRYYAAEGVRANGSIIPASDKHVLQYSIRVPLGVVACITPWNFPVAIPIWKIAPALICGNTVIWKPADNASLTAAKMMEIFQEVDLPKGVLNLVIGKGKDVGSVLVEKLNIQCVSFTGSTSTGLNIAAICAKRNIKFQTEMGGKNAAVVLKDADLSKTIPMILSGAFRSAGQKCTATSRIIVEESIYEPFVKELQIAIEHLKAENALHPSCYLGPVASKSQYDSVMQYVELAKKEGEILAEGFIDKKEDGYYIPPMIVSGVPSSHKLIQEEIFGPLAVILKAKDFDEAIELTNDTVYGLSASVFTNDLSKAHQFLLRADAGLVRVNQETAGVEYQAPFGGMKQSSSHTREQGQAALQFYTSIKTCAIKHSF